MQKKLEELYLVNYSHKPPDTNCEIAIDVDDFETVKYERCEDLESSFEFSEYGMTNNLIGQIA